MNDTTKKNPVVTQVSGKAVKVNENGIFFATGDGAQPKWLNVSQYASPVPDLPAPGQRVVLGLDSSGRIRTIVLDPAGRGSDITQVNTRLETPQEALGCDSGVAPDKDRRITRLACLNTATAILASQGPAQVAQVLNVAAALEEWVLR